MSEESTRVYFDCKGHEVDMPGVRTVQQQTTHTIQPGTVHVYCIPVGAGYSDMRDGSMRITPGDYDYKTASYSGTPGDVCETPQTKCDAWGNTISMDFSSRSHSSRGSERCNPTPDEHGLIYWNITSSNPGQSCEYALQYVFTST